MQNAQISKRNKLFIYKIRYIIYDKKYETDSKTH